MDRYNKYFEKRKCIICKEVFYTRKEESGKSRRHSAGLRPRQCKTCSKECSLKWKIKKNNEHRKLKGGKRKNAKKEKDK